MPEPVAAVADAAPTSAPAAPVADTTSTPGAPAEGPSNDGALTPEQRDQATIDRILGTTPAPVVADDAGGDGDAGEAAPAEGAAPDAEDSADSPLEITDELLDAFIDAYGEDELLDSARVRARVDQKIQAEADRRFAERQQAAQTSTEQEQLVAQGRDAVTALYEMTVKGREELAKAERGEEFDAAGLDPTAVEKHLRSYGAAIVTEVKRGFDQAFSASFQAGVTASGIPLTDDETKAVVKTIEQANRIEKDPAQGSDAAKSYLFTELTKFQVDRAFAAGKAAAVAEVTKRRDAIKKLVGEGGENAVNAAVAKLAKQKKQLPGAPVAAPAQADTSGVATMEAYRAAKKAGDWVKADSIAAKIAAQAPRTS